MDFRALSAYQLAGITGQKEQFFTCSDGESFAMKLLLQNDRRQLLGASYLTQHEPIFCRYQRALLCSAMFEPMFAHVTQTNFLLRSRKCCGPVIA